MPIDSTQDPANVITTLLLAGCLLMEEASADLVLPPDPSWLLLAERVHLLEDTVRQLQTLAVAARAAVHQEGR